LRIRWYASKLEAGGEKDRDPLGGYHGILIHKATVEFRILQFGGTWMMLDQPVGTKLMKRHWSEAKWMILDHPVAKENAG
jgi:hypothetical protein